MNTSEKVCLIIFLCFILWYVLWLRKQFKDAKEVDKDDRDF